MPGNGIGFGVLAHGGARSVPALAGKPVLANTDVGHTNPMMTVPLGGQAALVVGESPSLTITEH